MPRHVGARAARVQIGKWPEALQSAHYDAPTIHKGPARKMGPLDPECLKTAERGTRLPEQQSSQHRMH